MRKAQRQDFVASVADMIRICNERDINPFGYMDYAENLAGAIYPDLLYPHPSEMVWPCLATYEMLVKGKDVKGRRLVDDHMRRFYGK